MGIIRRVRVRLILDIAIDVGEIDPAGPEVVAPDEAALSARMQAVVLQNQRLLDQQIDLELLNFLEGLDRDKIKEALGLDGRGPYETHSESYLAALPGEDSQALRAAHKEGSLGLLLEALSDSFHGELTGATIER